MTLDSKMAENLCTRLCHDLTGPIGAINNGTEFLGEQGFDMENEVLGLIGSSAKEAVARLQFYRQAYGKLNEFGEADLHEKKEVTVGYLASTKITLDWPDQLVSAASASISQKMSRLLLNLIIIVSKAMIKGGELSIRVEGDEETGRTLRVAAKGESLKEDDEVAKILDGRKDLQMSPKTVQAYLTQSLVEEMGMRIKKSFDGANYVLEASRPATAA